MKKNLKYRKIMHSTNLIFTRTFFLIASYQIKNDVILINHGYFFQEKDSLQFNCLYTDSVSLFSQFPYNNATFEQYSPKFSLQNIENWASDSKSPEAPRKKVFLQNHLKQKNQSAFVKGDFFGNKISFWKYCKIH